MSARRYSEDEVGEIFALATSTTGPGGTSLPALAEQEGLTLEELQEVGREVGLSPERVAQAAASIEAPTQTVARRTTLGAPISVGRVVELPREPTDREWQILVAELRETFNAKGSASTQGDIREWTNGNLHVFLEPTEIGSRLRMGTQKFGARAVTRVAAVPLIIGTLLLVTAGLDAATFGPSLAVLIPTLLALFGGGTLVRSQLRLRRWGAERERQMEHIGNRARALLAGPAPAEASDG